MEEKKLTNNQFKAVTCLEKIRNIDKAISKRSLEIEALKLSASGLTAIRYDKEKVQTSPQNYMEMAMADAVDKEAENEEDYAVADDLKLTAYNIIRQMEDTDQRTMIEYYYLNGLSMPEISAKMYISERQAYYIRNDALEKFGSML